MKTKRISSGILIILGIALYIIASYISDEVSQGRKKITGAQESVDQAHKFSQLSPFSKDLGDIAADSAQKELDAGKQKADAYQILADWLHGSGIVIFIAGIGLLTFSFIRKKSS